MDRLKITSAVFLLLSLMITCAWTRSLHIEERRDGSSSHNGTIVVTINPGQQIRGFYKTLATGTVIYKFWGIRYGQPPTGDKRFAEPEEESDWQGIRDALTYGNICWQSPIADQVVSEDCLFLNVYTPSVNGSAPVMVWIHGGAYYAGAGSEVQYEGSTIARKGVVVVTINYRLGALGFSSTEDDTMPGNYGLLDQVLALKWVQKNIHAFGGDPGKVTIFGESAGSSSVSLLILSPLAKGLFHKAIMESGSALSAWAVERPATHVSIKQYTRQVGAAVGCVDADSSKFLKCLRSVNAGLFFNVSNSVKNHLGVSILATPRVETKFGFLPHYPTYILDHGLFNKVDTLRGFNSGEWSNNIQDPDNNGLTRVEFRTNFAGTFATYSLSNDSRNQALDAAERVYIGNETNPLAIRTGLVAAFRDILFGASEVLELDKYLANGGDGYSHYVYQLDYRVKSILKWQSTGPAWWGVLHSADLPLVFADDQVGTIAALTPPEDVAVGDKIQTWWTNFAKFGNPSATKVVEEGIEIKWDQYTVTSPQILHIDLKSTIVPYPRERILPLYSQFLATLTNVTVTGK